MLLPVGERCIATSSLDRETSRSGRSADQPKVLSVPVPRPLVHRALVDDVVADGLGDGGGIDRKRTPEVQADGQLAVGFLVDLLDDGVQALDCCNRLDWVVNVQIPLFG